VTGDAGTKPTFSHHPWLRPRRVIRGRRSISGRAMSAIGVMDEAAPQRNTRYRRELASEHAERSYPVL